MNRLIAVLLTLIFGFAVLGCGGEKDVKPPAKPAATESKSMLVDINHASLSEIMALKGIGEARGKAIVRGRPYARKDELVQRQIISQAAYDKIKDKIVAKQK